MAIGSRIVAGQSYAKQVGWIVDQGYDFPTDFSRIINSWGTAVVYRSDSNRLTTRAWNGYGPGDHRDFKYLTPKLRIDQNSLSKSQIGSNAFHMVCSSERCMSLVAGLEQRRQILDIHASFRPRYVFEPIPDLCLPSQRQDLRLAMTVVDVVSPNAEELAGFFSDREDIRTQPEMANWVIASGVGLDGSGALVVREGSEGATIYSRKWSVHLPAYHTQASEMMIVDPTGGGNAFLGGLTMAMSRKVEPDMGSCDEILGDTLENLLCCDSSAGTLVYAAIYATIAASYVIEQAGMPQLSVLEDGNCETWNGESFASRLKKYIVREKDHIGKSLQMK